MVTQQSLNRTSATHDLIEAKLFESGGKATAEGRSVDDSSLMATPAGLHMLTSSMRASDMYVNISRAWYKLLEVNAPVP